MSLTCNLCKTRTLEPVYSPLGSRMQAEVNVCTTCGLLQTLPRLDDQNWGPSLSHLADFGGVRMGKGFRLGAVETFQPGAILDVGANRGTFYDVATGLWPSAAITAVEPDQNICRKDWINRRIEEVSFAPDSFDFIYCVHTLEHLPDPVRELARLNAWLKPGGYLYLEVPNAMGWVDYPLLVEEFFIDRHLYHFTISTLTKCVKLAGLRVLKFIEISSENITAICSKSFPITPIWDGVAPLTAKKMKQYKVQPAPADRINVMKGPLAALGCGRIFRAFLAAGLDLDNFAGLYDDALAGQMVAGREILPECEIPAGVTQIAFSRHIKKGVRFDAGL